MDRVLTLIVVAVVLYVVVSWLSSASKEQIAYPFFPIDPMNVDPYETQAVFGQPEYLFQLSTTPANADYGAYQALQLAQNVHALDRAMNIDWQTNQGFNATGNADFDLMLSSPPLNQWQYL